MFHLRCFLTVKCSNLHSADYYNQHDDEEDDRKASHDNVIRQKC